MVTCRLTKLVDGKYASSPATPAMKRKTKKLNSMVCVTNRKIASNPMEHATLFNFYTLDFKAKDVHTNLKHL
jgi:Leucine-rich repeat (LRR) protein